MGDKRTSSGKTRRWTLTRSVAALPAAVAVACVVPGGSGGAPTPAARRDVTLYYQNWDNLSTVPTVGTWYKGVFDRLAERIPGVRVEYVLAPFGEIVEKLIVTVAAGTPPDVSVNSIIHGRELFEKSALLPLDDLIRKAPELAPARYFDVANVYRRTQGKHFGLPLYTDSSLLAVNSRLLREAGLDPKAADLRTWDDLVRYCERLTKREGGKIVQLGFAFGRPGLPEFATYVYGNGAELHDAEVTRATFNSAPNVQRVAEVLGYRAANFLRFGANWADELQGDLFQPGKAAITYNSVAIQVRIRGGAYVPKDFEHWLVANPKGQSGSQSGVTTWVNMVVLPRGGKHPDLAFELARSGAPPMMRSAPACSSRRPPTAAPGGAAGSAARRWTTSSPCASARSTRSMRLTPPPSAPSSISAAARRCSAP